MREGPKSKVPSRHLLCVTKEKPWKSSVKLFGHWLRIQELPNAKPTLYGENGDIADFYIGVAERLARSLSVRVVTGSNPAGVH